jgi:hypothetical protein
MIIKNNVANYVCRVFLSLKFQLRARMNMDQREGMMGIYLYMNCAYIHINVLCLYMNSAYVFIPYELKDMQYHAW